MEDFTGKAAHATTIGVAPAKATVTTPKPAKRNVPADRMEEFKKEIEGSDLTKIALVEALKKK